MFDAQYKGPNLTKQKKKKKKKKKTTPYLEHIIPQF